MVDNCQEIQYSKMIFPRKTLELVIEAKRRGLDIDRIHTDAIKENLVPPELTPKQVHLVYATEADVLNMALFGMTAKDWRDKNRGKKVKVWRDNGYEGTAATSSPC